MNNIPKEIETLHPLEVRILTAIDEKATFDLSHCMEILNENPEQAHQVVSWLHERGYIEIRSHQIVTSYDLTQRGVASVHNGLLEERLLQALANKPQQSITELAATLKAEQAQIGSAVGRLVRSDALTFDDKKCLSLTDKEASITNAPVLPKIIQITKELLSRAEKAPLIKTELSPNEQKTIDPLSKKRGAGNALFRISEKTHNTYFCTEQGQVAQRILANQNGGAEASASTLTPEMLQSGEWKGKRFRRFNINIPPSRVLLGRTSTYSQYLRDVKDKLVALGFPSSMVR